MLCDVAAFPFQAHANYVTWPIDFGLINLKNVTQILKCIKNNIATHHFNSKGICFVVLFKEQTN